jgi:hypothetical protein
MDLEQAYRLLGLAPGDTLETARAKYRIKAKQCHPDRFACDQVQMKKAEIDMTRINVAFQLVKLQFAASEKMAAVDDKSPYFKNSVFDLSWLQCRLTAGKSLLQKITAILASRVLAPGANRCRPAANRARARQTATAAESFDAILQRKMSTMINKRNEKK